MPIPTVGVFRAGGVRRRKRSQLLRASAGSSRGICPVRSGCQTAKPLGPLACLAEALERLNAREEVRLRPSGASARQPSPAFMSEGWWTRTSPVGTERHTGFGRLLLFGRWRDSAASGAVALGRFAASAMPAHCAIGSSMKTGRETGSGGVTVGTRSPRRCSRRLIREWLLRVVPARCRTVCRQ